MSQDPNDRPPPSHPLVSPAALRGVPDGGGLGRLKRAARRTEWRIRLRAALDAFVAQATLALIAVAAARTLVKVAPHFPARFGAAICVGAALSAVLAAGWAAARRLPQFAGAMTLDRVYGHHGRITNALAFDELPREQRTALMLAAIEDACTKAQGASPRGAVSLGPPREWPALVGMTLAVFVLGLFAVKKPPVREAVKTIDPPVLAADDIDLFREEGARLLEKARTPELAAAVAEFNQIVEDLAKKRLDRTEAFRKMEQLESRLLEGRALDAKTLEQQLQERAAALKKSELTRPAAEALAKQDFPKAERALADLAKRMREKPSSFNKGELDRLRDAMKKAAEGQKERLAALEERRQELEEQLLKKKESSDGGALEPEEERLLKDKKRELERLDREKEKEEKAGRQLDRLDRDLAQAAEDILRELGVSADDLDHGAEDIHRMADEQMTDKDREELRQRLEDLREQLRQEGQGGKERLARMRRFSQRARGQGSGDGKGQGHDKGDGQEQGEDGQDGEEQGQDGQGDGEGKGRGQTFVLGPNGEKMLMLGRGQGQSSGSAPGGAGEQSTAGQGQGEGQDPGGGKGDKPSGEGTGVGGHSFGTGHDANVAGKKATNPAMGTEDVQAAGLDTGQGASRSEVILGAAEKGFKGGAYKRVYTEYRTSAEEQMHHDQIPPGASDHVRRYFDLIRPRE